MLVSLVSLVWSILNTVLRGYLIKTFWAWFIISQFPQLPTISILPAIGFSFFVGALTPFRAPSPGEIRDYKDQDPDEKRLTGLFIQGGYTLGILMSLAGGWIVHHFM
jgi:hypothetical protein